MNKSIRQKLERTSDRFEEISNLLADPEIIAQKKKFRDLSKEYARLNKSNTEPSAIALHLTVQREL